MESHEVIRNALAKAHVKEVADKMGLSLSLIYKWGEVGDRKGSGSPNPLDRVNDLYQSLSSAYRIVHLLSRLYVNVPRIHHACS